MSPNHDGQDIMASSFKQFGWVLTYCISTTCGIHCELIHLFSSALLETTENIAGKPLTWTIL